MVTGFECAGLVLAVLPLFIEAGKAYSEGVETILNVSLRSRRDEELSDFYDEFYWAVGELAKHIEIISDSMSDATAKYQPSSALDLSEWTENPTIETRLKKYFGSEGDFNKFTLTAKRIVQLLAQLLKDQGKYVSTKHQDESHMFNKLKTFALDRKSSKTKSTFFERFEFFRKKKDRDRCIERLGIWNGRLDRLIQGAKGSAQSGPKLLDPQNQPLLRRSTWIDSIRYPSSQIRALTKNLYTALSNNWSCSCTSRHEAKFCLKLDSTTSKLAPYDAGVEFDFLISITGPQGGSRCWQEGTITINISSQPGYDPESRLVRVCDTLRTCARDFQRVRLAMEENNGQQSLWRLDPKPKRIHFLETESPATLQELLSGSTKMGSREKRELALTCAYSLLLLHDSPWLSKGWGKTELFFFSKLDHEPDFRMPFLSTRFELPAQEIGQPGSGAFHPNSSILALGILLIEIFNEKPIESWRTPEERAMVTPSTRANTDLKVASRVVAKMDDSPHTSAIEACLNLDWVPEGRKVSLEDADTSNGLWTKVIDPIEKEIEMIK